MGWRGLVLQHEVAGAGERTALGEDVDVGVDGDDLRLGQFFVLLEVALVVGLNIAAVLGGEVFIEDVGVVEIPRAAADGGQKEDRGGGNQARGTLRGQPEPGAPAVFGAAAGQCDGDRR